MHETHALALDFIRTDIKSKQGAKFGAQRVEEELEGSINEPEKNLNQVSAVTKQEENTYAFKHIVNVKEIASKGAGAD